ncbi:MAG: hypothetical protein D4S01_00100 [Dehalococcoidia bacterium]|nr:MAG: hypothetical protein D4S01_00100 [Dehalococcoidia bacterium]
MYTQLSDFFNNPQKPMMRTTTPSTIGSLYTPPPAPVIQEPEDMYTRASKTTKAKYGVDVPPHFLKAVQQQESSGIVDKDNLNLFMGITHTAIDSLGKDYIQPESVDNVVQNSSNYLAQRAKGFYHSGKTYDWSTPGKEVEWYVRQYVGLKPGETRNINGQKVSYEDIAKLFENLLIQYKQ